MDWIKGLGRDNTPVDMSAVAGDWAPLCNAQFDDNTENVMRFGSDTKVIRFINQKLNIFLTTTFPIKIVYRS